MAETETAERTRPRVRPALARTWPAVACVTVWLALVLPNRTTELTPGSFVRIPVEGLALSALALVLRPGTRRAVAVSFGLVLGLLAIVKAFDMGFFAVLDRPFDPVNDWFYLGPGLGVLGDSIGRAGAVATAVGAGVLAVGVLVLMPLAAVRVGRLVAEHRPVSARAVVALAVAWALFAVGGPLAGSQVASASAARQVYDLAAQVRANLADRQVFAEQITEDDFSDTPDEQLLTTLRGKDVLLVFVESYGRVAVEDSDFSPEIDALLDAGTRRLRAAGFESRSAFLTSPTFGAASWLAHASLQSGLWVDSQQRYNQLITEDRLTLTRAFGRAGWRTVHDVPANTRDWPDGASFYGFDTIYDSRNVGYEGPEFGYASMPDQYTLETFRRLELEPADHPDVMAEIDLVSSHHPWAPLPELVDWPEVGDGSVFDGMPERGQSSEEVFSDPDRVRAAFGESIEYSLECLISFVETYPDPDLVLVLVGDHQPHKYVSGEDPGHDVPITIVAHDPAVMRRISDWDWQPGMNPAPDAPMWRMDAFRDRFLTAFGPPRS